MNRPQVSGFLLPRLKLQTTSLAGRGSPVEKPAADRENRLNKPTVARLQYELLPAIRWGQVLGTPHPPPLQGYEVSVLPMTGSAESHGRTVRARAKRASARAESMAKG